MPYKSKDHQRLLVFASEKPLKLFSYLCLLISKSKNDAMLRVTMIPSLISASMIRQNASSSRRSSAHDPQADIKIELECTQSTRGSGKEVDDER